MMGDTPDAREVIGREIASRWHHDIEKPDMIIDALFASVGIEGPGVVALVRDDQGRTVVQREMRADGIQAVADALDGAWGDWIADTGCIPDCFTIHGPRTTRVEAYFDRGNFAQHVLGWLIAKGVRLVPVGALSSDVEEPT